MRLKWLFFVFFLLSLIYAGVVAQLPSYQAAMEQLNSRGELYFVFRQPSWNTLEKLAGSVSIDNISNGWVTGWANRKGFIQFLEYNIPYQVVPLNSFQKDDGATKSFSSLDSIDQWNFYPSYNDYIAIMNAFQSAFPDLCRLYEIGLSINGKKILAVKISDSVGADEPEPRCFLTSSMHGDELTGYVMMLNLIDTLLRGYGTDGYITRLIDDLEIYINPLANPDGTYFVSNSSVSGAVRGNALHIDLNRNFPDPEAGAHPDGYSYQPENIAMMNFMRAIHFTLAANFHGGAEVINYPWDTWPRKHPDDNWYYALSRQYADTVHYYAGGTYMTALDDGITNGYQWYRITGGRQDYMNYFLHGREVTMEISTNKIPAALSLPLYFHYNYRSLLNYLDQCRYGIRGRVTDSVTGQPLRARIEISGHDADSSHVFSDTAGWYYRLIYPGTYTIKATAGGYNSQTISSVIVNDQMPVYADIRLSPLLSPESWSTRPSVQLSPVPFSDYLDISFQAMDSLTAVIEMWSLHGELLFSAEVIIAGNNFNYRHNTADLPSGLYLCRIKTAAEVKTWRIVKISRR